MIVSSFPLLISYLSYVRRYVVGVRTLRIYINRQGVSRGSRISSAVPLLRPADFYHVFYNLPCYIVPLVRVFFVFSRTVVSALLIDQGSS